MSKQNWQLQRRIEDGGGGFPQWRDICTRRSTRGPAAKSEALLALMNRREACPQYVFRIVKVSPL